MSKLIESQTEFQALAEARIVEAKSLLDAQHWDGAYYLAGYSVELALKSCIIKLLMARDVFPKKEFSKDCYTHKLSQLIELADLTSAMKAVIASDQDFELNWRTLAGWSEEKRYHRVLQSEAEEIYLAITDASHGVLPWIKTHW